VKVGESQIIAAKKARQGDLYLWTQKNEKAKLFTTYCGKVYGC
jgi:hypothetical protein